MDLFDDYSDMSWLTQVPNEEKSQPTFNVEHDVFGNEDILSENQNIVSLEEEPEVKGLQVLYDNVVCEAISSDEEINSM